jgi:hypothetical protein
MSDAYSSMPPQGGNPRDRITSALMQIQQPPPAPAGGAMQSLAGSMPQAPLGVMPQSQPAALGAAAPPAGAMGPIGGAYQPGLRLPGIMPPGQLPLGMAPQQQQPGQQGVQQPY